MKRKFTFLFLFFWCLSIGVQAQITSVNLTFTPVDGGNAVTANATNGVVSGAINLLESTEYRLAISLGDQDAALKARQDQLQFFFVTSTEELLNGEVNYDDMDANNRPVGFTTLLTTECKEALESGTLQIVLNDYTTTKSDTSSITGGVNLLDLSWTLNVNDDPSAPECENEEEIITDVVLTFVPTNGTDTVRARAQDPDGEGVLGLEILDNIVLASNTTYNLSLELTNAIEGESITEEIEEEDDEHLFLFAWTAGLFADPMGNGNADNRADAVNYNDVDENGLPVGLSTTWTTGDANNPGMMGDFRVILKHQPDIKTATSGINDGGTDVDLTWDIQVEPQVTRVDLVFTPVDGGSTVTANAINGANGFQVSGAIDLVESTEYSLAISLGDNDAALKARQDNLQFFFTTDSEELLVGDVGYADMDGNSLPVGFTTTLTTECKEAQESGNLQITLSDFAGAKMAGSMAGDAGSLFSLTWALNVNDDPSAPECENEEEIITDVILSFIPRNGGDTVVARAQDPDGEGVLGLEILDNIVLASNTTYDLSLELTNSIEGESITEEIKEEDDEHLFLFAWTADVFSDPAGDGNIDNRGDLVNYTDFDENNLPVGLSTTWTTSSSTGAGLLGNFRVVLKHQPDVKTATSGINDGGTDVDLTWEIRVGPEVSSVDLTFTPVDGGDAVTANAVNNGSGFDISGPIDLLESTEYRLDISLGNQDATFKSQLDDLQFFFTVDSEELLNGSIDYNDMDANNLPVGFTNLLTTECKEAQASGNLQIVLSVLNDNKSASSSVMDGLRLFNLSWPLNVNDDPNAPECENEEEIITDVTLIFVPTNGGDTIRARAQDPDGEGVLPLEVLDTIMLATNTTYNMSMELINAIEGESITEEIEEEDDEHLFLFAWTDGVFSDPVGDGNIDNRADAVNYNDVDENNLPVGLSTAWTTADGMAQTGTFRVVLKHQPDIKTATSGINDGGTDVDLTWVIQTMIVNNTREQASLNQSLRLAPNPARQTLNWTIDNQISTAAANIRIFDQMGRLVLQTTSNEPNLNISTLNPGNYIFQIQTERTIRVQRFVKVN